MTDEQINKIINCNQRLLILLGYATSMLFECEDFINKEKFEWFKQAIDNVVYLDKPLPPFTGK
jgi:hypothetical protein